MHHTTAAHTVAFARYGVDLSEDASLRYVPRPAGLSRAGPWVLSLMALLALAAAFARLWA